MSREVLGPVVLAALTLALSGWARRAVWAMLRGTGGVLVIPAALLAERRRARREPPLRLPAGYAWRCALYVAHDRRMHRLAGGTVTGPWTTSVDVEREVMARWVAVNGWPAVGRLCCRAEPVAKRAAPARGSEVFDSASPVRCSGRRSRAG